MNLKSIFNKPICFIAHGHSLKLLDERIQDFKNKNVIWVSLNNLTIPTDILKKIDKELDVYIAYSVTYQKQPISCIKLTEAQARGGSMQEFLHQLLDQEVEQKVFLFGADGYSDEDKLYYKADGDKHINKDHKDNTKRLNETFPRETGKLQIYNCSPNSHITIFKKISIDECLSQL